MIVSSPFDPKQRLLNMIHDQGGWVNAHAHIDRSFILNDDNFNLVNGTLMEKWDYPDTYKRAASIDMIHASMKRTLELMIEQGVTSIGSFIDVDPIIEDKAIRAAMRINEDFKDRIEIKWINQVVKGVLEPEARKWFEVGAEFADIIGGLPEKDAGHESEHLDVLFETAKKYGNKPLHIHVDQLNLPTQRDTELLIEKTIEYEYQGKVTAVHCISVGAQDRAYRHTLYRRLVEADIMVVACPCGWIDNSWVAGLDDDVVGPIHNAVTPVKEMIAAGVTVALGTDNIQDIYKPFNDGSMWMELRMLLETQRLYDLDVLARVASSNGRKVLFLEG